MDDQREHPMSWGPVPGPQLRMLFPQTFIGVRFKGVLKADWLRHNLKALLRINYSRSKDGAQTSKFP